MKVLMEWVVKNDRDLRERGANGDGEDMDKERIGASSRICKPLHTRKRLSITRRAIDSWHVSGDIAVFEILSLWQCYKFYLARL